MDFIFGGRRGAGILAVMGNYTIFVFLYRKRFEYTLRYTWQKEVNCMNMVQQTLDYQKETEENQKRIREMVLDSYHDIAAGKGRDCNEFFEELEKNFDNF